MSNPLWLYLLSLLAMRDEGDDTTTMYHTPVILAATEQADLQALGLRHARQEYPPDQGFRAHHWPYPTR